MLHFKQNTDEYGLFAAHSPLLRNHQNNLYYGSSQKLQQR